jgi:hypothetical protein
VDVCRKKRKYISTAAWFGIGNNAITADEKCAFQILSSWAAILLQPLIRGTTPSRGGKRFHLKAYRKELAPCLRLGSSVVVGIVPSVNGSEKVFEDEIRYLAAQPLASGEVGAEVHAAENPA